MSAEWTRYAARAIGLAWAGWWLFFGVASGLGERLDPLGILIHALVPGGIFFASVLVAWRWEGIGGSLLIAEGLAVLIAYPFLFSRFPLMTILFVLATMALPPLVAGALFLSPRQPSAA